MKICPRCHQENDEQAKFCENCGYEFTAADSKSNSRVERNQEMNQTSYQGNYQNDPNHEQKPPKKWPLIVGAIALVAILTGVGVTFANNRNQTAKETIQTSTTTSVDVTKYDRVIADAKELAINGKHRESNMKLASIPASALGKSEFASIKEEVDDLKGQNDEAMEQKQSEEEAKADKQKTTASKNSASSSASGFTGDFAKWANTYSFYYQQSSQKQSSLTISDNGAVKQTNSDGTQYYGKAAITSSGGNILSYETNERYPDDMPDTKTINPNVQITVTWDNGGGSQTYYGYLSYSSRLALTDGVDKGAGVNEVWVSY